MTPSKKRQKPREIRRGSFVAKLYSATKEIAGKPYRYFRLSYHEPGGRRVLRDFKDESDAITAANEAAGAFAMGRPDALSWSPKERAEYDAAIQALEGRGVGLFAAVQGYLAHASKEPAEIRTVAQTVDELLADRVSNGCSDVHTRDLSGRLGRFAKAHQCAISSVTAERVREYLRTLTSDAGEPAAPRTRLNVLRVICALFIFAGKRHYVSPALVAEVRGIEPPRAVARSEAEILTPDEMRAILEAARADLIPSMAVGGFAGLRTAEIARLDWQDIRINEQVIVLAATKTKTASRRIVPISDNLATWLVPYAQKSGKVNPATNERTLSTRFSRASARAGIQWVANGLRHSFISYRLAVTHDPARVATEAGNSAQMVHRVYKALVTEAQGKAWFDIRPTAPANVIPMPARA